jgi:hypothetical protein
MAVVMAMILCGTAIVLFVEMLQRAVPVPARDDVWIPENAVVLDSAHIEGAPTAYLFKYDTGAFGYSTEMVSLGTIGHKQAVIRSDYITGIRWSAADTLIVELDRPEYTMVGARQAVVIVPIIHR